MNRNHLIASHRRAGFTLVEILVVIAIIAILASLLLAAVVYVRRGGVDLQNRNDILQLSTGLQKFKTKYGFYPPNKIRLRANMAAYSQPTNPAPDALDASSVAVISSMWPNLTGATNIPWAGATAMPAAGVILDGDQCLVFFLGGIPNGAGNAPVGFSLDPVNPAALTGDRLKFLDFDGARIQMVMAHGANNPFPSFMDAYFHSAPTPQPFVYFSSNKRPDGYDTTANTFNVLPYKTQNAAAPVVAKHYNPDSFQIISAGLDGQFGPGGLWTAANYQAMAAAGKDDMSNFSSSKLGVGP